MEAEAEQDDEIKLLLQQFATIYNTGIRPRKEAVLEEARKSSTQEIKEEEKSLSPTE